MKHVLTTLLLASVVAGCSSVPVPEIPSGSSRISVNSPEKIHAYKERMARKRGQTIYEAPIESRANDQAKKSTPTPQIERVSVSSPHIEIREQSIIFRIPQEFGKTYFSPSIEIKTELLRAAHAALHIEIRGRTDASRSNPVDDRIAFQRAINARRFLIENGIDARKIKTSFMGFGGYVAPNNTVEGRNRNRRVEIETMDMETISFR